MSRNFFERQEAARRVSVWLLFYFAFALAGTLLAMDAVFYWLARSVGLAAQERWYWHVWSPQALLGSLLLIIGGSLLEYLPLRLHGGRAVAEMVGASRVDFGTREPALRQLINVTEEMSIASGISVPALYVMEHESGINAFVAGYSPNEAVLVVTAGSLQALDRHELQGVIAHEFSHILNGDMRLNIRLISLLAGLLALGRMGGFFMRSAFYSSSVSRRGHRRGGLPHVLLFGLALCVIGYIGLFFGRLIKAAISRQRERLADAASVQFTRYPEGLAGALLKIRDAQAGSWLSGVHAETMSHMGFGETLRLSRWFATHPPLEERVQAIAPGFLARYRARQRGHESAAPAAGTILPAAVSGLVNELPPLDYAPVQAADWVARVGVVNAADMVAASSLRQKLPAGLGRALETTQGSVSLLYAILAEHARITESDVIRFLHARECSELAAAIAEQRQLLQGMVDDISLPLLELLQPRLALLDERALRKLLGDLQAFCQWDNHLSIFEFSLLMLLAHQLLPHRPLRSHFSLQHEGVAVLQVLAVLLRYSGLSPAEQERALRDCVHQDLPEVSLPLPAKPSLANMSKALRRLQLLAPGAKQRLLELCVAAVQYDGHLSRAEYDLLRVIAGLLDCPMPLQMPSR